MALCVVSCFRVPTYSCCSSLSGPVSDSVAGVALVRTGLFGLLVWALVHVEGSLGSSLDGASFFCRGLVTPTPIPAMEPCRGTGISVLILRRGKGCPESNRRRAGLDVRSLGSAAIVSLFSSSIVSARLSNKAACTLALDWRDMVRVARDWLGQRAGFTLAAAVPREL